MKKYILLLTISYQLLAISQITTAQVNSLPIIGNKFTFGIDGGLAMPCSDYGSSTPPSSSSTMDGFAKSGFYYDAYAGFKFSKLIGIMVLYGSNSNSFNTSDLGANYSASGGYTVSEYLAGPYLSLKLVKIKIEVKLLAGMVSSNYPTISSSTTLSGTTVSFVDSYTKGSAFGYCAGAKIKYMMLGGMLGIGLGLNYVGSDINFKGTSTTDVTGYPSSSTSTSGKMNISIIQPTLGLSLDI